METITAVEGVVEPEETAEGGDVLANYDSKWSQSIAKGIDTGSQWISWGFVKGSEYASALVEKVGYLVERYRWEPIFTLSQVHHIQRKKLNGIFRSMGRFLWALKV